VAGIYKQTVTVSGILVQTQSGKSSAHIAAIRVETHTTFHGWPLAGGAYARRRADSELRERCLIAHPTISEAIVLAGLWLPILDAAGRSAVG
jgi:hypothetical protein